MNPEEYGRMHALETEYWWFVGRRAVIGQLLQSALQERKEKQYRESTFRSTLDCELRLLDIGCGTGANLPLLCSVAECVVGLDYSPLALQFARDHLKSLPISLLQGDGIHLPFRDESFDIVTMLDVLEHLEHDAAALRGVLRVLRPGGMLVWSVPAYQKLWSAHDEALHHFRRYEYHGLRQLLRRSGFVVWRLSFAMSVMPPLAWFWRRFILPFKPRRPKEAKRHSEGAVLPAVPPWMNQALVKYLEIEGRVITHRPLNFGTSLVGIARKPQH